MSKQLKVLHLTSSRFYGGPERQMLGLAEALRGRVETAFASFSEDGLNASFLEEVRKAGFTAFNLKYDTPRLFDGCQEIAQLIEQQSVNILICNGYKAGMV